MSFQTNLFVSNYIKFASENYQLIKQNKLTIFVINQANLKSNHHINRHLLRLANKLYTP